MLNALSSTLKSESDDQSRNAPPTIPSAVAFVADRAHGAQDRVERRARERPLQLADEERALVGLVGGAEQRERQEEQRHEGEQREVGDHRRQMGSAVGEELPQDRSPWTGSMLSAMDAAQALADLTEISSQVVQVAIVDARRLVLATTIRDAAARERFVAGIGKLLDEADAARARRAACRRSASSRRRRSTAASSSSGDDGRLIAATTRPTRRSASSSTTSSTACAASRTRRPRDRAAAASGAGGGRDARPRKPRKKADASA